MINEVISDKAPAAAGPYSQAIRAGNLLVTSGQIPVVADTGAIPETIEGQTRLVLDNLSEVLKAGDARMCDVIDVRIYLSDMKNFALVNLIYTEYFEKPYPSRVCVGVSSLPKGVMIMIEATAYLEE